MLRFQRVAPFLIPLAFMAGGGLEQLRLDTVQAYQLAAGLLRQEENAAFLILGGVQDKEKAGAVRTLEDMLSTPLPIIASGGCWALANCPERREADRIAAVLEPAYPVQVERESRDTLGNIVLSYPLLHEVLGEAGRVYVVTHEQHAWRAFAWARTVLPESYSIRVLSIPRQTSFISSLAERIAFALLRFDMRDCEDHDTTCFTAYIHEKHPFYCGVFPENTCGTSLYTTFAQVYARFAQCGRVHEEGRREQ